MGSLVVVDAGDGLVYCRGDAVDATQVYDEFRRIHGGDCAKLAEGAKVLFKVSIVADTGASKKPRPVQYVGAPNETSFSRVLDLLNRKFSTHGAFLLEGGFAINPEQSVGNVFMRFGYEFDYHTKADPPDPNSRASSLPLARDVSPFVCTGRLYSAGVQEIARTARHVLNMSACRFCRARYALKPLATTYIQLCVTFNCLLKRTTAWV